MNINDVNHYNKKVQDWYFSKTGFRFDIQTIGQNTKTVILKSKKSLNQIRKGVWLKKDSIEFEDGNFTNVYDLFWEKNNNHYQCNIHTEQSPFYLADYVEANTTIIATLNGSYFFLIDVKDKNPLEFQYNFCMRGGKVRGLPSSNEPILITEKGNFIVKELNSTGSIQIGKTNINWVGSDFVSKYRGSYNAVLYNSASSKLLKPYDPKTGVRLATLNNKNIHTPKNSNKVDLIILSDKFGNLEIAKINIGGGTHYFDGLFILQIANNDNSFRVKDKINPLNIDSFPLSTISSGITIGKSIYDPYFFTTERIFSRDARSVLALDKGGRYHFVVFDGSKYIPKFRGVSANDIRDYFNKEKFEWAYFLDGGSSSRIIYKDEDSYNYLANELVFKKITLDTFLWDWKRHRKMTSCITLNAKNDTFITSK